MYILTCTVKSFFSDLAIYIEGGEGDIWIISVIEETEMKGGGVIKRERGRGIDD